MASPPRILAEDGSGRRVVGAVEGSELLVGRAPGCGLRLDDRNVSRLHCRFLRTPGGLVVEDLQASHGTFVNGERLRGRHRLREGDVVGVGDWDLALEGIGLEVADAFAVTDSTPLAPPPLPPRAVPAGGAPAGGASGPAPGLQPRASASPPGAADASPPERRSRWGARVALLVAVALAAAAGGYAAGRILRGGAPAGSPVPRGGAPAGGVTPP